MLSWCSHILVDYKMFKTHLEKLTKEHGEYVKLVHNLAKFLQIDALSELFVAWVNTLLESEVRDKKEVQKYKG